MAKDRVAREEKASASPRRGRIVATKCRVGPGRSVASGWVALQERFGNRAVQRLLVQCSGNEPTELDDEMAARINRERSRGQALDESVSAKAGAALGYDFSGVRVHTSPEADSLSRALSARAFTTGRDVFFRAGVYEPHSASGQELLGHELAHVVQQSSGGASTGHMIVNPPGDALEQQAASVGRALTGDVAADVQEEEQAP